MQTSLFPNFFDESAMTAIHPPACFASESLCDPHNFARLVDTPKVEA